MRSPFALLTLAGLVACAGPTAPPPAPSVVAALAAGNYELIDVHVAMHEAGKFQLEELANVDLLPPVGAYLIVAPMKIKGGSGAPARVFGVFSRDARGKIIEPRR